MRKLLMTVVAGLVFMGTSVTTKAASLIRVTDVSVNQQDNNNLVLKHANEIFGNNSFAMKAPSMILCK